jgi:Plasmid recombination enzyme
MSFAILRIKKLKTAGVIQAVGQHNSRERETLNANPEVENRILIEPQSGSNPKTKKPTIWEAVQARIKEAGAKVRSDSVLACEVFMGASPEYFRPHGGDAGTYNKERLEAWVKLAEKSLREEWGDKNVISAILHLDETTPHVQAVVVPIDKTKPILNAKAWTGGRQALAQMQTRHADVMKAVGLLRGIKGSKATNETVQSHYNSLMKDMPEVPLAVVSDSKPLTQSMKVFAAKESQRINQEQKRVIEILTEQTRAFQSSDKKRREAVKTALKKTEELLASQARESHLRGRVANLEQENNDLKNQFSQYRDVPLVEALTWFSNEELKAAQIYLGQDSKGKDRILNKEGKVVGRNAIDLAMLVYGCKSAAEAVGLIEVRQGEVAANQAINAQAKTLREESQPILMPERIACAERQVGMENPSSWEAVQNVYKRVRLSLARTFGAQAASYFLTDTKTDTAEGKKAILYDPQQSALPEGSARTGFMEGLKCWKMWEKIIIDKNIEDKKIADKKIEENKTEESKRAAEQIYIRPMPRPRPR